MLSQNHKVGDIVWVMYGHDSYPHETIERARVTKIERGYIYTCQLKSIWGYSIGHPYDDEHTKCMWDTENDIPDFLKRYIVK